MNERLTSEAATTYAKDGELFMASENTKDQENQPWDPIETPLTIANVMDIPVKTREQLEAKAAWSQLYGGKMPNDPTERQMLGIRFEMGSSLMPQCARQADRTPQPSVSARHVKILIGIHNESKKGKRTKSNRKEQLHRPEDDGPQITRDMTEEQQQAEIARWQASMDTLLRQEMANPNKDRTYFEVMGIGSTSEKVGQRTQVRQIRLSGSSKRKTNGSVIERQQLSSL